MTVDIQKTLGSSIDADNAEAVIDRMADQILHQPLSPATKKTLLRSLNAGESKTIDVKKAAALILGSPDFQRR